jgi:hypothetical protein
MKKEKLVLTDLREINGDKKGFKVKKVTNTTRFFIGQYMSKTEVDDEIMHNAFMTVEIVAK